MSARYAVGIDLGTTQSVVAYVPLGSPEAPVELLAIPQVLGPGTVGDRQALSSFLYLASSEEVTHGSYDLPWAAGVDQVVGDWARQRSAEVPTRTVSAAKSWLCHRRIDRRQPILPWQAPEDVPQLSPVAAAESYLQHLRSAWDASFPQAPLATQRLVLTVPASFDASARELTREAALAAGLPADLVLLEEPQAAVYAWLAERGEAWRRDLSEGDRLLVCDVGGGTTDFSLIGVESEGGELILRRQAVGDHLLVGGDNMDLALAHLAQGQFAERGVEVDAWQSVALWHSCRAAKERLLGEDLAADAPERHGVTVLGRGSRLIGGAITIELERRKVLATLLDGFLPFCALSDRPVQHRGSGFLEVGLPFEADAAITRHLARFLSEQAGQAVGRPTHVLYNGGVLKAGALRQRLGEVLASWFDGAAPRPLAGERRFDTAVARGAAFYGQVKEGQGVRIRGGTARSYYVGIETTGLAVPGAPRPLKALCVVPRGMEEGTEIDVPGGEIGLVVGESARFRFFSSTVRDRDRPGQLLERWAPDSLAETDALEATLTSTSEAGEVVPVRFRSRITELGIFELWCTSTETGDSWKMEFSIRDEASA